MWYHLPDPLDQSRVPILLGYLGVLGFFNLPYQGLISLPSHLLGVLLPDGKRARTTLNSAELLSGLEMCNSTSCFVFCSLSLILLSLSISSLSSVTRQEDHS